jgi:hypothetical protein
MLQAEGIFLVPHDWSVSRVVATPRVGCREREREYHRQPDHVIHITSHIQNIQEIILGRMCQTVGVQKWASES